jgi:hypothetical protein
MDTIQIMNKFGEDYKLAFIFRHGIKTPDNHVAPECLADIKANGIPGAGININAIHEGSDFVRTKETVEALECWLVKNGATITNRFGTNGVLGNSDIFNLYTEEIRTKIKTNGLGNYEALEKYKLSALMDWENDLTLFLEGLFHDLAPGDVCAVCCHTPTVEVIFNIYANDVKMTIKEMEGIFLLQDRRGNFHAIRQSN